MIATLTPDARWIAETLLKREGGDRAGERVAGQETKRMRKEREARGQRISLRNEVVPVKEDGTRRVRERRTHTTPYAPSPMTSRTWYLVPVARG